MIATASAATAQNADPDPKANTAATLALPVGHELDGTARRGVESGHSRQLRVRIRTLIEQEHGERVLTAQCCVRERVHAVGSVFVDRQASGQQQFGNADVAGARRKRER